jgi:hypothetical protein
MNLRGRTTSVIHRRQQPPARSHWARGGWIDAMVREKSPAHGNGLGICTPRVAAYRICPANACHTIASPRLRPTKIIASGAPAQMQSEDGPRCGSQRWLDPDHDSVSSRTTSVIHRRRLGQAWNHEARGGWIDAMVREESRAHGNGLGIASALVWVCPSSLTAPRRAIAYDRLRPPRIMASGVPLRSGARTVGTAAASTGMVRVMTSSSPERRA